MILPDLVPENSQRNVLLPRTVFPHSDPKPRAEEKLSCRHQIAFLRRLELQHSAVPDEGVQLTVGGEAQTSGLWSRKRVTHRALRPCCLLVSDSLDGLGGALVVVFLHVPVHGAQLHLPPEVDIHRALLHCGVDELI